MSEVINGRALAEEVLSSAKQKFQKIERKVTLSIIRIGDDQASLIYIRNKEAAAEKLGVEVKKNHFPKETEFNKVSALIDELNADESVDGILLQLPLPEHINPRLLIDRILPEKDVDGLTSINQGKLFVSDDSGIRPCTPMGVLYMIKSICNNISGMYAVVLGRSATVGRPMAQLLLRENCTVSIAHSCSKNLPDICRQGDIVVSAVGCPLFVKADWIKEGAIVIDVGINRDQNNKIIGDVDFLPISRVARAISPVPGGVGPMTVAYLMHNVVAAASERYE
ncbi:MAG: bifunctional 5,10-methylenetetrahydrofolate dehydrogenase/5,10-methenyltetrahydrofolate cyclohydrolase [Holosporales bacterium]|jgi:methylenetetrahydrofolate dehydrogenase (NADP+)/methenyltetrahydrofolate cyclohydrolase|nr:bifunctional 5,10-methylenetetrahydrofolate dehydrogenase/5,10-methenyltetrahydrofolate cyclohydrolase [Holosporales bacterium]